jgi:tetratricopeptide (TPR) repeat protein
MVRSNNRFIGALLLAALLSGCATSGALHSAQLADQAQDYDRAVVEYTRALRESPDNRDIKLALDRAKQRASLDHYNRGRRLAGGGRLEEALLELQMASELNPPAVTSTASWRWSVRSCATRWPWPARARPELETLIERTRDSSRGQRAAGRRQAARPR